MKFGNRHYLFTQYKGQLRGFTVEEVLEEIRRQSPREPTKREAISLVESKFGIMRSKPFGAKSFTDLYNIFMKAEILYSVETRPYGDEAPIEEIRCRVVKSEDLETLLDELDKKTPH